MILSVRTILRFARPDKTASPWTMNFFALRAVISLLPAVSAFAWDHPGHMIVNHLALNSLPTDFPAFVHEPANVDRILFLSGEPDRWSHSPDLPLRHDNWPEHFFDLEQIGWAGLDLAKLPSFRYPFVTQFAAGRDAHPERFAAIDPTNNSDHTREFCGFLPWGITEYYGMLKAAFASLKVYEELGSPEEIANTRADIVYLMGIMGHYVGDSAQPLHTTENFNGWTGDNPHGYTTWNKFHSWIDSGLINKSRITYADLAPRFAPAQSLSLAPRPDRRDPVFVAVLEFIVAQNQLVESLYQLEKTGKLGNKEQPVSPEGRAFVAAQLSKGGKMLGAIWLTAWRNAAPDMYLRGVLLRRQAVPASSK